MDEAPSLRSGKIIRFIGTGDFPLELRIKELRLLQTSLDSGPSAILTRLQSGLWLVDDVIEPIRLGLIGSGMSHVEAKKMTDDYVCPAYLLEYVLTATAVLFASLVGDVEDQPDMGELPAPTTTETLDD